MGQTSSYNRFARNRWIEPLVLLIAVNNRRNNSPLVDTKSGFFLNKVNIVHGVVIDFLAFKMKLAIK